MYILAKNTPKAQYIMCKNGELVNNKIMKIMNISPATTASNAPHVVKSESVKIAYRVQATVIVNVINAAKNTI